MARHTHGNPNLATEVQSYFADYAGGFVAEGGIHTTSGTTAATIASCQAYVTQLGPPRRLRYVEETAGRVITYAAGNGTYWTMIFAGLTTAVSGWTRVTGTHYLYKLSATEPVIPNRGLLLFRTTVAGGVITAILDYRHRVIGINTSETFSYTTSPSSQWTFLQEGKLTPANGITINHTGKINAGFYQIFVLTAGGLINFPNGSTVQAEWWGAKADGVTESAAAINSAINANPTNMAVELQEGTYIIEEAIVPPIGTNRDWSLTGKGQRTTVLQRATGFIGALILVGDASGFTTRHKIQELALDCVDKAVGTIGLRGVRAGQGQYTGLHVENCEKGIWLSGGGNFNMSHGFIELNTKGLVIDNTDNLALTFSRVEDTLFRNNPISCLIDGDADALKLIRAITFSRVGFENDALDASDHVDDTILGNVGLKIIMASQIHAKECWFEDNDYHVKIEGNAALEDVTKSASAITFTGCQFGNHHPDHIADEVFLFDGDGAYDGRGCYLTGCVMTEGDFQFNQYVKMHLFDNVVVGTGAITGTSWYQTEPSDTDAVNYSENPTTDNWRPARLDKDDGTTIYQRDDMVSTETTTDAVATTLAARTVTDDSTVFAICNAVARSADNAISAAYMVAILATASGGTAAIVAPGVQTLMTPCENSAGMAFTLDVSTNQIRARGTGVAATTITWQVEWKILRITSS